MRTPVKMTIHHNIRGSENVKLRQSLSDGNRPYKSASEVVGNFVLDSGKQEFDLLNDPVVTSSNMVRADFFKN
jgi:hypothetical protein